MDDLECVVNAFRLLRHGHVTQLILSLLFLVTIVATLVFSPLVITTAIVAVLTYIAVEGLDRLCFTPVYRRIS